MKLKLKKPLLTLAFIANFSIFAYTQTKIDIPEPIKTDIENVLTLQTQARTKVLPVKIDSILQVGKTTKIYTNSSLSALMITKQLREELEAEVTKILGQNNKYIPKGSKLEIFSDGYSLNQYQANQKRSNKKQQHVPALVRNLSEGKSPTKGLTDRHLALWQSHGKYYNQQQGRWLWQRARMFQTVEDSYTQAYVLPFLVPMLENAGANVLLPRERDWQPIELIVDNDDSAQPGYSEINGQNLWEKGNGVGFKNPNNVIDSEINPFREGTFRQITSLKNSSPKNRESMIRWTPNFPKKDNYGVYVSYASLPKSTTNATYTVKHEGGETKFAINQQMGGNTWIYLGNFLFDKGDKNQGVFLSNVTGKSNEIVTADAVRFGGGMGNIARKPIGKEITENVKSSNYENINKDKVDEVFLDYPPTVSGYPRFLEGARYSLQWYGMPDSIYSYTKGKNDYTDDYMSRPMWVNYIAGGSQVLPNEKGLNIPIDLALAFHTDAGTTLNDSIIGTLGISMTHVNDEKFANGLPRILSRDLTQDIMMEIEKTIRTQYNPKWTMRNVWNKSYAEARIPEVPSLLLELLSHQNFADMQYGLDPDFQFDVSRAIYKGILKFIAQQNNTQYVIQPLPVNSFSAIFSSDDKVKLQWEPTPDSLEPSANATSYRVYVREGNKDFDNGTECKTNSISLPIKQGVIYSYKIVAVNEGGNSFPSEILTVCNAINAKGVALIINGFNRVAAPDSFDRGEATAGFVNTRDSGVAYKTKLSYIGEQKEFDRSLPWVDDDDSGFGDSYSTHDKGTVAGNSFDYPIIHGESLLASGYSFVSCSAKAVEDGQVNINNYKIVDLILGKQKLTLSRRGFNEYKYEALPLKLQQKLESYMNHGGNLFLSGAYFAMELKEQKSNFGKDILKIEPRTDKASPSGKIEKFSSPFKSFSLAGNNKYYEYYNQPNTESYSVESPDGIMPTKDANVIYRFSDSGIGAGVAYKSDKYKSVVVTVPFETIKSKQDRDEMMKDIINFFDTNN